MGIGSAESILSEANVPRNDPAYRIAALPSVARNDVNATPLNAFAVDRGTSPPNFAVAFSRPFPYTSDFGFSCTITRPR